MGDQSSRQYRRHPRHDALKNDNKFRNEKRYRTSFSVSFLIIFIIIYVKPYCKNKVKLFPSFFLVKSVFHNWHEHNYQDYPHIPSQASVLALPFPENN